MNDINEPELSLDVKGMMVAHVKLSQVYLRSWYN